MFVKEGATEPTPIASMPGVVQHSRDSLRKAAVDAVTAGVGGLMLFGVPPGATPSAARRDPDGVLNVALRDLRAEVGDATVIMADTCLDEFTDHGHCGVLDDEGGVDNDTTLAVYAQMAVAQADAGAHLLGPSGMMDGQVGVIRAALDAAGHRDTGILAYTAKYASAFYGPFREAVDSQLRGDRKTYQQDGGNVRESLRELALDLEEGADLVMVKPAMAYLDVLRAVAEVSDVPVAAYQVSGEYAMVRRLRRTAGSTATARSWRRSPRSAGPARTSSSPTGRSRSRPGWTATRSRAGPPGRSPIDLQLCCPPGEPEGRRDLSGGGTAR